LGLAVLTDGFQTRGYRLQAAESTLQLSLSCLYQIWIRTGLSVVKLLKIVPEFLDLLFAQANVFFDFSRP
jgi:hypothetical protein